MKEVIAGLICTVLWASMMVIVSMVQIDPIALMYTTVLVSVITLGAILLFNMDKHILTMHRLALKEIRLIVFGGVLIIAYNTCIYVALKKAEPTEVVIINYLWSIILMVLLGAIWGKKIPLRNIVLGFMAFLGASISLLEGKGFGTLELGHFLALLAALFGAGYLAIIIKLKENIPSTSFIYFSMLVMPLCVISIFYIPNITPEIFIVSIYLGSVVFVGGQILWVYALHNNQQEEIALLSFLTPIIAVGFLSTAGFEVNHFNVLGLILVVAAAVMIKRGVNA